MFNYIGYRRRKNTTGNRSNLYNKHLDTERMEGSNHTHD